VIKTKSGDKIYRRFWLRIEQNSPYQIISPQASTSTLLTCAVSRKV